MNILNTKIIRINSLTLYFLLILLLSGYIKIGLIIFLIVIVHELGHILIAKCFNYKIIDVTIYPFGGITRLEKDLNTPIKNEMFIAGAGIFFQIILGLMIYLIPLSLDTKTIFYEYNLSVMLFNLLPIIPLDGSIILNSILNHYFSYKTSYKLYILISIIGVIIYLFFNYWYALNNYLIVTLFIYKIYLAIKNYKYLHSRFLLERYLHDYDYKKISTKEGNLDILKIDTFQYFKNNGKIESEKKKLQQLFDK